MKGKLMHQCKLQSDRAIMITWLSNEIDFKVGDFITLKDTDNPKERWKVITKGKGHPRSDVKQKWESQDLKRDSTRKKII